MIPEKWRVFLASYTGKEIEKHLIGHAHEAFQANWRQMECNYRDNVDAMLLNEQILFCPETEQALYDPAWVVTHYMPGTRPALERTVSDVTRGAETDFEKALCLLDFCRDLYQTNRGRLLFYGGAEEELIRKGEQLCECLARLMVALCEVISIPARIITHIVGGHLTTEVYIDGHWSYMDPRTGLFFVKEDGIPASLSDLLHRPSVMDDQPAWVVAHTSVRWTHDQRIQRCREIYFTDREVNTIKPYSLSSSDSYRYGWTVNDDLAERDMNSIHREYAKAIRAVLGKDVLVGLPYFDLTLAPGQTVALPLPVLAIPRGTCVPPKRVRFRIDGRTVWETPDLIPLESIHTHIDGVFSLFGDNGFLDPQTLNHGNHLLEVEDIDDTETRGSVEFMT